MGPETPLGFRLTWKSRAVIDHAQNHLIFHPLQSDHNFSRLRMFVGINDRFTSNAVELTCRDVTLNMEGRFEFQPAGYPSDFPVNQIPQCIDQTGCIDINTMQRAGEVARVCRSVIYQLRDFFDVGYFNDSMVFQS